jgi:hypothetical protein
VRRNRYLSKELPQNGVLQSLSIPEANGSSEKNSEIRIMKNLGSETTKRLEILGRWQAPDKGEVQPTPAFRLLRVGAESFVKRSRGQRYQGDTVFFVVRARNWNIVAQTNIIPVFASTYRHPHAYRTRASRQQPAFRGVIPPYWRLWHCRRLPFGGTRFQKWLA